jgi:hypothetical protein
MTTHNVCFGAAMVLAVAATATAQDLPTNQLEDHAGVVRQDILTRSLLRQRQNGRGSDAAALSPNARRTCRNKGRAAANLGADNPKVRRLYALCAQAGY